MRLVPNIKVNLLSTENLRRDIFGGATAAVIALPLALAFGVASGRRVYGRHAGGCIADTVQLSARRALHQPHALPGDLGLHDRYRLHTDHTAAKRPRSHPAPFRGDELWCHKRNDATNRLGALDGIREATRFSTRIEAIRAATTNLTSIG